MGAGWQGRDNRASALEALYQDLERQHITPFWAVAADADHDEDRQRRAHKTNRRH